MPVQQHCCATCGFCSTASGFLGAAMQLVYLQIRDAGSTHQPGLATSKQASRACLGKGQHTPPASVGAKAAGCINAPNRCRFMHCYGFYALAPAAPDDALWGKRTKRSLVRAAVPRTDEDTVHNSPHQAAHATPAEVFAQQHMHGFLPAQPLNSTDTLPSCSAASFWGSGFGGGGAG